MSRIVVGIDGGGTKTRAVSYGIAEIGDRPGKLLGEWVSGSCNIAAIPVAQAMASVKEAAAGTGVDFAAVSAVCAAVAGYSFLSRREEASRALSELFPGAKTLLAPDYEAAFRGAFPDQRGIVVIAGTGSIAYGLHGAGSQPYRAGGYGFKIDDSGSGYGVGRRALAAILQARDGSIERTELTDRIGQVGGIAVERDLLIEGLYGGSIEPNAIAALADTVGKAADDGDRVSRCIIEDAGVALARLVEAIYRSAFRGERDFPIAKIGGLWSSGSILADAFEQAVRKFAPGAIFARPETDPATGAALIAADLLAA